MTRLFSLFNETGKNLPVLAVGLAILLASCPIHGQPDPAAQQPAVGPVVEEPVLTPISISREPQGFHERFTDYATATFGTKAAFGPAFRAAKQMVAPPSGYPREWRQGAGAFGRNYGDAVARRTSLGTARFLTGALLHEDFRYRRSTSTNILARSAHALAYTLVDKSDSGHNRIAVANFAGAAASGFVGTLYLPPGYNNLSHAGTRSSAAFAGIAIQNLLGEFAPDLLRATRRWRGSHGRSVLGWWGKGNNSPD